METIRSEEEEEEEEEEVSLADHSERGAEEVDTYLSGAGLSPSIVINPFWAEKEEQRELLCHQLTVKSQFESNDATRTANEGGHKTARRPLVKQKKYCQSADDVGALPASSTAAVKEGSVTPSPPVTINVTGTP